jgi:protein phosphatase
MSIKFISDVGKTREKNEDSYLIIEDGKYLVFAVADGMGGHNAGDRASKIAVDTIKKDFAYQKEDLYREVIDEIEILKLIYKNCNDKIYTTSKEIKEYSGMGTTLTLCIINMETNKMYVGNVGDSRCYLINSKDKGIRKITKDHSLIEEMISNNEITREESFDHPKKNIITRALGTDKKVDVDIFCSDINNNNIILLCTDGLTNHIKDEEIKDIILTDKENSIERLIKEVNQRGGSDNTTIILFVVEEEVNNG